MAKVNTGGKEQALVDQLKARVKELEKLVKDLVGNVNGLVHNAGVINDAAHTIIEFTEDTLTGPPE